jgi:asparagine synthase (glutamine-hydrolysing)
MSGILGLVGEGSPDELHAMAARMAYRGRHLATWSPAPGILLGELFDAAPTGFAGGALALDASGNLHPHDPEASLADPEVRRARVARDLAARGVDALRDLRGNFAFAFWNERDRALWLACDRQRYKRLYTVELPGRLAFASDYKALLALADCPARVDRDALQAYLLTLECPGDRSLLAGVRPLSGAHLLEVRVPGRGGVGGAARTSRPWWQREARERRRSFRDEARALRDTLAGVLAGSLAGQSRIGLTLSGGLDSAALVALVREVRPDLEIATYTIGHGEDDREIVGARETARHFRTEHHEHVFAPAKLPAELPAYVWRTEDLAGRDEAVLQQVITRVAATRDRIVVCGIGADMNFCGMPRHRLLWLRDHAPWPLRGALDELFHYTQLALEPPGWLGRRLVERVYGADRPERPPVAGASPPSLDVDWHSLAAYRRDTIAIKNFCYHEPVDAELGVSLVAPFSSPEVFEFALGCRLAHLIDVRQQKKLLRAAVADLLPPALVRRRKTIQRLRHDRDLSDQMEGLVASLDLDGALSARGLLPPGYVKRLCVRGAGGAYASQRVHLLWALACAELWLRQFVDDRGRPIPGFPGEVAVHAR